MSALLSFPTVPFTVAMGVVLLYWLFVIIGAAGIDLLDGDGVAGGVKAAGEALTGAAKGAGEALTGAPKALGTKAEVPKDGLFNVLGFGNVPVTVSTSVLVFFAWSLSLTASTWLSPSMWLTRAAIFFGAVVASFALSKVALQPLSRVFSQPGTRRRADLVGTLCRVTSAKVDAGFGTAEVTHTGAAININITCHTANTLKKGERAMLIAYDAQRDVFDVEPLDFLEPQEVQALDDPDRAREVFATRIKLK